jgi:hypothetical protein
MTVDKRLYGPNGRKGLWRGELEEQGSWTRTWEGKPNMQRSCFFNVRHRQKPAQFLDFLSDQGNIWQAEEYFGTIKHL